MAVPTYQTFKPYYEETLRTPKTFPLQDITIQTLFPPNLVSWIFWFVKPCYNCIMSPRHFAAYQKRDPKGYQTFSDNMWNSFVTITHAIGLSPYFSFTPEFLEAHKAEQAEGRFAKGEIPGDQD